MGKMYSHSYFASAKRYSKGGKFFGWPISCGGRECSITPIR